MAARALAGLISEYGLLMPQDIRQAPKLFDLWQSGEQPPDTLDLFRVDIEFIGVFDSVMGGVKSLPVFNPIRFPHHRLSETCKTGVHILAADEDRRFFENVSWTSHRRRPDGMIRQVWMPGVHSDIGGTANEFWGRASFLAMAHFIDVRTSLRLDSAWMARKQDRLKRGLDDGRYHIEQHRPLRPFSLSRYPIGSDGADETYHPIIDQISSDFQYNGKENFNWHSNCFERAFSKIPKDRELTGYFSSFL
jgi:hypothetical protein